MSLPCNRHRRLTMLGHYLPAGRHAGVQLREQRVQVPHLVVKLAQQPGVLLLVGRREVASGGGTSCRGLEESGICKGWQVRRWAKEPGRGVAQR